MRPVRATGRDLAWCGDALRLPIHIRGTTNTTPLRSATDVALAPAICPKTVPAWQLGGNCCCGEGGRAMFNGWLGRAPGHILSPASSAHPPRRWPVYSHGKSPVTWPGRREADQPARAAAWPHQLSRHRLLETGCSVAAELITYSRIYSTLNVDTTTLLSVLQCYCF